MDNTQKVLKPIPWYKRGSYILRPWLRCREVAEFNTPHGVMLQAEQYVPKWAEPLDWLWRKIFWRNTKIYTGIMDGRVDSVRLG